MFEPRSSFHIPVAVIDENIVIKNCGPVDHCRVDNLPLTGCVALTRALPRRMPGTCRHHRSRRPGSVVARALALAARSGQHTGQGDVVDVVASGRCVGPFLAPSGHAAIRPVRGCVPGTRRDRGPFAPVTPGRKPSISTRQPSMSRSTVSTPSGSCRSSAIERRPRCEIGGLWGRRGRADARHRRVRHESRRRPCRQHHRAERARPDPGDLDHPVAGERAAHKATCTAPLAAATSAWASIAPTMIGHSC